MLLLYCNNGIVVGHHDDTQNVAAELYGDGTRVIPWRGNLSDLEKAGDPPPDGIGMGVNVDTRPYAQPAETTQTLLDYAAQTRWEISTQGITFQPGTGSSINADTDRISQSLLNNLATYAQTLDQNTTISFTQNNAFYHITAADAITLFNSALAQVQNARDIEAVCIADLTSASPTIQTYDDVDAKFSGARRAKPFRHHHSL